MTRERLSHCLFLCFFLFLPALSWSQNFTNNWYFGNSSNRSIQFSRGTNEASVLTTAKQPLNTGGSAVVSSPVNGDLLFYTNGVAIFDKTHTQMPGSLTLLNGDASKNQPVVVGRVPGQLNQYFVIVNEGGAVFYVVVDMTLPGSAGPGEEPLGDILNAPPIAVKRPTLLSGISEAMVTVPHSNGIDFWLITHTTMGSPAIPRYDATLFTSAGAGASSGTFPIGNILNAGNFAYNPRPINIATPDIKRIAVSPNESQRNVEIIEFNTATGDFTFSKTLTSSAVPVAAGNGIYDAEWSNNDRYLYISQIGTDGTSRIMQYNVREGIVNQATTITPVEVTTATNMVQSYGLQIGPDSAIYHAYLNDIGIGQFIVGKIENADTIASATLSYTDQAFPGTLFEGKQFPSFLPLTDLPMIVDFNIAGTCMNAPTFLTPIVSPLPDSVVWNIDGQDVYGQWSHTITFDAAGNHTVILKAYLNGQESVSAPKPVNILDPGVQITLERDQTACSSQLPEPQVPNEKSCTELGTACFELTATVTGSADLEWYGPEGKVGEKSNIMSPQKAGFYYLVATAANGCQVYAPVNLKEYKLEDMRANVWFFGTNTGIDFNPLYDEPAGPAITRPNNVMDAPEGTATMSDRNGEPIFFTDGNRVWDREFTLLTPPGQELLGENTSAQSSLIIPVPGDETLYYIFTTQAIDGAIGQFELRYTLFNVRLRNGLGDLVDGDSNPATPASTVLFTRSTEKLTGTENWLVTHEYGNNSFRAYPITPDGIGSPIISGIGLEHGPLGPADGSGYMVLDGDKIAVASGANTIQVFDFIDSTGVVSNPRTLTVPTSGTSVYGVAFGDGGDRVFATVLGDTKIYEFEYNEATDTYGAGDDFGDTGGPQPGAIQDSPLGLLVALQDQSKLGMITSGSDPEPEPNGTITNPSTYTNDGFNLTSGKSQLGLPNFLQTIADQPTPPAVAANGFCLGQPTNFTANGWDSNIDMFAWDFFGDNTPDQGPGAIGEFAQTDFTYPAAGTFPAKVIITNKCEPPGGYPLPISVTINPGPDPTTPLIPDPNNNTICTTVTLTGTPGATHEWNTGETTQNIVVSEPGRYSVDITLNGCTVTKNQTMLKFFTNLEVGDNRGLCVGETGTTATLSAGIQDPFVSYTWSVTPIVPLTPNNSPHIQAINTNVAPGDYTYRVTVSDGAGCLGAFDEATVTIRPSPTFTATPTGPATCGGQGSIDLNITGPPNTLFEASLTGPSTAPDVPDLGLGIVSPAFNSLNAGVYTVFVFDQIATCRSRQNVTITDPVPLVDIAAQSGCMPGLFFQVNPNGSAGTWEFFEVGGTTPIETGTTTGVSFPTTPSASVISGREYFVRITTSALPACTAVSPARPIVQDDPYIVSLSNVDCSTHAINATFAAGPPSAPTKYEWSTTPGGGIVGPTETTTGTTTLLASATPVTYDVKVVASGAGACPGETTRQVTVANLHTPGITPTTACADVVTLTATPTGSDFRYEWSRGLSLPLAPNGTGPQRVLSLADNGFQYSVRVINNQTGCGAVLTPPLTASVSGTLTVNLASPALVCEGNDLALTATPSNATGTTYQWFLDGTPLTGLSGASITTPARAGTYSVIATRNTCPAEDEVTVSPFLPTPIDLGLFRRICPEEFAPPDRKTVTLRVTPTSLSDYTWTSPSGEVTTGVTELLADEVGFYTITALNGNGCESTDNVELIEDCDPLITGPNAFRPSSTVVGGPTGKSNNQFWLLSYYIEPTSFEILIFNRWGEMVFQSNDPDFDWNGGYNDNINNPLPAGTYSYVVRYKELGKPDQSIQEQRGGVVLLR